jgi:glycerophosphoryl diester phosphodiesterase
MCGQLLLQILPLDAGLEVAQELGLDAVVPHVDHLMDDPVALVQEIRAADLATVVWGVDTPEDVALMASAGVDAIITDDPGMARQVIDQR